MIRDQIHVPCIARQLLNHWTTREVPRQNILRKAIRNALHLESPESEAPTLLLITCHFQPPVHLLDPMVFQVQVGDTSTFPNLLMRGCDYQ